MLSYHKIAISKNSYSSRKLVFFYVIKKWYITPPLTNDDLIRRVSCCKQKFIKSDTSEKLKY